jgi:hypothetical protein
VAGFEYCAGRHADLTPASPDLNLLDEALTVLGETPAPEVSLFSPLRRLGFEHPAMEGDALVHTNLGPSNLIVTGSGLRIVDWAMASKVAPWMEPAMLTAWLIGSGHTPHQAEQWLARQPAWQLADGDILDYLVRKNAQKWATKSAGATAAWIHDLADWTAQWANYRRRRAETT